MLEKPQAFFSLGPAHINIGHKFSPLEIGLLYLACLFPMTRPSDCNLNFEDMTLTTTVDVLLKEKGRDLTRSYDKSLIQIENKNKTK